MDASEIATLQRYMTPDEKAEIDALLAADAARTLWRPLPGPQTQAFNSTADVIGYGGAAGGGKTDLAVGKALMQHHEVLILRREATQLKGVLRRLETLLGDREGYNGQDKTWRNAGPRSVFIEFGSCPNLGDETKHQGNPHDLLVFDEAPNFLESQVNFLLGWNRTSRAGVRSQALLTFNPPTTADGRWIVNFFGPWIDRKHPLYPTPAGQVRWCVTVPLTDETVRYEWLDSPKQCVIEAGQLVFDFDRSKYRPEQIITPKSRTFIPSRISDNPFLANTGYMSVLQAMPEPLRSQMLNGDFQAGMSDDPWQVIPTMWIEAAMARWVDHQPRTEMLSMGVDIARGGKDNTAIATRHRTLDGQGEHWYSRCAVHPGSETPNGPMAAGLVIAARRNDAPIHIDVIGVGAAPYDTLNGMNLPVIGVNVAEKATATDRTGRLTFKNLRSQLWWQFREDLDPANNKAVALPPDPQLLQELAAPKWEMSGLTIKVESREDIIDRIGRSPDRATAYILARIETPKRHTLQRRDAPNPALSYDPFENMR